MKNPLNTEQAPAKINLFLHVGAQRADGFHDLQSVAVFARAGDVLAFAPAGELTLAIDGPHAASLGGGDNLVLRAARLLAERAGGKRGAAISLTKNLPVASGLGGGSSDAAATLRGLEKLWDEKMPDAALGEIAAEIGSDVPVCLAAWPAWMEGRGEVVTPLERMPPLAMLLVNPGVAVSTREVFARLGETAHGAPGRATSRTTSFQDTADLLRFLETTANDLEAPARALSPVIGEVLSALRALPGALMTRMSGSGATCFAIFPDEAGAARAAATLREEYPRWWIAATMTAGAGIEQSESRVMDIGPTPDGI